MFAEGGAPFEKDQAPSLVQMLDKQIPLPSPHLFMKNWVDYLKEDDLLWLMSRWRSRLAQGKRRKSKLAEFVRESSSAGGGYLSDDLSVQDCLPSRRKWIRLGSKERHRLGEIREQEVAIYRTAKNILGNRYSVEMPQWVVNFRKVLVEIATMRNAETVVFRPPRLHLVQKSSGSERRCLGSYEHLADKILISRAAVYLRDRFDACMNDCSFAFRNDSGYSYKTAIDTLVRYRRKHMDEKLYVAECDIQSFFDVIDHQVVLDAYDGFVEQLESAARPDDELRRILQAYLRSYSRGRNLSLSTDPKVVAHRHLVKPLEKTGVGRYHPGMDLAEAAIGIPQGGALSPLIANIVLHSADRAVCSEEDSDLLYLRFCDDIIIVHTNRDKCKAAIDRYMNALDMLKLPAYPLKRRVVYGKEFFEAKSKGPFLWTGRGHQLKSAIPWVSFLGVNVRYDGAVRVRQSSIEKHETCLKKELKLYKEAVGVDGSKLRDNSLETKMRLLKSFESHVVAMGVGYATERQPRIGRLCWAAAFPLLTRDGPAAGQLRRLDSMRGHVIAAFKRHLGFSAGSLGDSSYGYYGRPYSYYGVLTDVERHSAYPTDTHAYGRW